MNINWQEALKKYFEQFMVFHKDSLNLEDK